MGSCGRIGEQVPWRAQGDGDGRLAGRQDGRGQRRLRRLEMRGERPDDDEVGGCQPLAETGDVGLAWRRRAGGSRPRRGCRRRSAAASVGGTVEDVSAGVRSAGIDWTTAIRASAAGVKRQQPVVVADEGDRTSGQLARRVPGARRSPTTSSGGWSIASQPAAQLVQPARGRSIVAGIDQAAPLRLHEAFLQPLQRRFVRAFRAARPRPARRAAMASMTCADPWARACMSRASVTVTPSNPSCPRSRSRRTAADRLVGRSASWPGSAKWPVITTARPRPVPLETGPARARPARHSSAAPAAACGADPRSCRRRPGSA